MTGTSRSLDVLGLHLVVKSDDAEVVAPFLAVFGRFETETGDPPPESRVEAVVSTRDGSFKDGARTIPLAPGRLRAGHVHNLLYTTLVRSLDGVLLLHAAALEAGGKGWIIGGPSGSGKTSLAHALSSRGLAFLGDDLAPLTIEDGLLHPFPRRLGLDAGAAARIGHDGEGVRVGHKRFVTPEELGARVASRPVPLGGVILMNPYGDTPAGEVPETRLVVGLRPEADAVRRRLQALADSGRSHLAAEGAIILELDLTDAASIAEAGRCLEENEADIIFHSREYARDKTYADEPLLEGLSTREAAIGLLRETLNREPQSALMRRHDGQVTSLLFELLGLLEGVTCARLTPGPLEETADLLVDRLANSPGLLLT